MPESPPGACTGKACNLSSLHCMALGHSQQAINTNMPLVLGEVSDWAGIGAPLRKLCDLQIATDRVYELQDQFGRATVDLDVAKEQISELQRELAGKRNKVTNAKLAIPALTHRASVQASTYCI